MPSHGQSAAMLKVRPWHHAQQSYWIASIVNIRSGTIASASAAFCIHYTLTWMQETQTKPEGQIHFFPVLFKGNQLYEVMAERCGSSQNSAPAEE